jgi:hypothetical protein
MDNLTVEKHFSSLNYRGQPVTDRMEGYKEIIDEEDMPGFYDDEAYWDQPEDEVNE